MRDLRMPFFQPPTGYDEIATGLTQGFLHLMGCLLVEGAYPGQPRWINGWIILPQRRWMDGLLAFGDEDDRFIQNAQMHNAVCRRTRSCRRSTLAASAEQRGG